MLWKFETIISPKDLIHRNFEEVADFPIHVKSLTFYVTVRSIVYVMILHWVVNLSYFLQHFHVKTVVKPAHIADISTAWLAALILTCYAHHRD